MQIELIGCTGAGKSTLAQRICEAWQAQGIDIVLGEDFVLDQVRLNWIRGRLLRKLVVNVMALFAALLAWPTHREAYRFAARVLYPLPVTRLQKIDTFKNVLKRIGIYEIIHYRGIDQQVVLIDEGVLQAAHYLFVHVSAHIEMEFITLYAGLIPLPDAIVYLRQPESTLIDRTMRRGHKRIPERSYGSVAPFIKQAVGVFDGLVQYPAIERRLLVVNGTQDVEIANKHQDEPTLERVQEIITCGLQ